MTTTICDLSVDWNGCPYCSMLKGCVESAESTCRAASERLDQAYADYRSEREAGRAEIGTGQWSVWQDRLRYLEQQLTAAHDTWGNAIDEWADCIHTHRRLYEDQQREAGAEPDRTDVLPETEEMEEIPHIDPLIRADKLMDILNREEDAVEVTIESCDLRDLDASDVLARLATIQTIRTQLEKLINQAKENTNA